VPVNVGFVLVFCSVRSDCDVVCDDVIKVSVTTRLNDVTRDV